ncbi:hypothetical protein TNCV_4348841 [Trichonephila clavipes]|nr:hypothetical protein TNCV_4348841 [Trichonephila clavipes]
MVLDLVSKVNARAQKRVCPKRTVLQEAQCAPRLCLVANSTCCCSTEHCFSFLTLSLNFLRTSILQVLLFYLLVSCYSFNYDDDDAINIKQKRRTSPALDATDRQESVSSSTSRSTENHLGHSKISLCVVQLSPNTPLTI